MSNVLKRLALILIYLSQIKLKKGMKLIKVAVMLIRFKLFVDNE